MKISSWFALIGIASFVLMFIIPASIFIIITFAAGAASVYYSINGK